MKTTFLVARICRTRQPYKSGHTAMVRDLATVGLRLNPLNCLAAPVPSVVSLTVQYGIEGISFLP